MNAEPGGAARLAGVLLALATVVFVWGSFAERSGHDDVAKSHGTANTEQAGNGESPAQHAAETGNAKTVTESSGESEYRPLGVNLESTPLVLAAGALSLLLAALVVFRPNRVTLVAVVVVGVGFALLEVVEVVHQANRNRTGLLILALTAALLHMAAAVFAARALSGDAGRVNAVPAA